MGYKQELNRAWSGFSNFAISFSIISVLAGCFTAYGFAWNSGGPIAISIGWPLVATLILIIGFSLAELVAKYPTSGGIYWFAGKLGGPIWAWFTGWFNLAGLVGVVASVDYACAGFMNVLFGAYDVNIFGMNFGDAEHILAETFVLFAIILIATGIINIFRTHLLAVINNVSVWWHVVGVAVIVVLLVVVPDTHQDIGFVFSERINNSGFNDGGTGGLFFWLYLLPIGFLLTQYTITGFDASAHISEETHGASRNAARGVWTSIFYSAVIGWIVLLAITFAVQDAGFVSDAENGFGAGSSLAILSSALELRRVQGGAVDLHGRAALLRARLPDQRLADVLRVLARPRHARLAALLQGQQVGRPVQRRDRDGDRRADHHAAGALRRSRHGLPGRLLRGRLDLRDRALRLLRDPDLPALEDGRRVRAGLGVEPRQQVALDEPDQHRLDRDHLYRRPAADEPAGRSLGRPVGPDLRELRAARARGAADRRSRSAGSRPRSHFTGQERNIDAPVAEEFAPEPARSRTPTPDRA